ncbi:UNVERIFIED_CONTAM: Anaphase-promoting complex subunit [Sesamum radiatum]|uniref:Anaphase-promoting complex subunit n=1 Tax=Sesamum radiatum TaxID=300843 RepID=A0AAW2IMY2_SESRA
MYTMAELSLGILIDIVDEEWMRDTLPDDGNFSIFYSLKPFLFCFVGSDFNYLVFDLLLHFPICRSSVAPVLLPEPRTPRILTRNLNQSRLILGTILHWVTNEMASKQGRFTSAVRMINAVFL